MGACEAGCSCPALFQRLSALTEAVADNNYQGADVELAFFFPSCV